jgi:hypothetical protein
MLSDKELKALDIWTKYHKRDIESDFEDSFKILDSLIALQQAVVDSKAEFPIYIKYIDTFTTKFILHSNTIINFAKGTSLNSKSLEKDFRIIDIPSMYLIIRAQLECFLMFDFIYIQPLSDEEKEFRYWNWKYDNLIMRSKIKPRTDIIKNQQNEDKEEIIDLKDKIENSRFIMQYTKNQRKEIINKGNSKLYNSWEDLIVKANMNLKLFDGIYPLLSSYAHTGAHSLMNLKEQNLGWNKNHSTCHTLMFFSKMILCLYISRFKNCIKSAEIMYNMLLENTRLEIEFFNKLADIKEFKTST